MAQNESNPVRALILKRLAGGGSDSGAAPDEPMPDAPPEDAGDPMTDGANDMIAAVKAGDTAAMGDAFRAMFKACEMEPHMEDSSAGGEQG